jgi:recombination protein RecA
VLDLAVAADIIDKRGSWYLYGDTRIGQGRENARTFLKENPDILGEIETRVLEGAGLAVRLESVAEAT